MIFYINGCQPNIIIFSLIDPPREIITKSFKNSWVQPEKKDDMRELKKYLDEGQDWALAFLQDNQVQCDDDGLDIEIVFVNAGPGDEMGTFIGKTIAKSFHIAYNVETILADDKDISKDLNNIFFGSKNIKQLQIKENGSWR